MDKITKEQFNKALLICDKYLSQEKDKILFIENKIIEINQQKEIITEHTTLSSWFKLKKGDIIKLLRTGGNANTKIKQGDLLTVTQINTRTVRDNCLVITVDAKKEKRKYRMVCKTYGNNSFFSPWVFEIINQ